MNDAPTIDEDYFNFTLSHKEWLEESKKYIHENDTNDYSFQDTNLARSAPFFMLGPIAKYGENILLAQSRSFENFVEAAACIDFEKIFLYRMFKRSNGDVVVRYCDIPDDIS